MRISREMEAAKLDETTGTHITRAKELKEE